MDPFYKQDIFFFITTIAVVLLSLILIVVGIFVIKILNDIRYISKKARAEADLISDDLRDLRQEVKMEGFKIKHALGFFTKMFNRHKKK